MKKKNWFLAKRQYFGLDQTECIDRPKFNVAKTMISVFDRIENIVEQGKKASYQYFLFFQQCFQKLSISD